MPTETGNLPNWLILAIYGVVPIITAFFTTIGMRKRVSASDLKKYLKEIERLEKQLHMQLDQLEVSQQRIEALEKSNEVLEKANERCKHDVEVLTRENVALNAEIARLARMIDDRPPGKRKGT